MKILRGQIVILNPSVDFDGEEKFIQGVFLARVDINTEAVERQAAIDNNDSEMGDGNFMDYLLENGLLETVNYHAWTRD